MLSLADSLERPAYGYGVELGLSRELDRMAFSIGVRYAVDGFKTGLEKAGITYGSSFISSSGIIESRSEYRFHSISIPLRWRLYPFQNKGVFFQLGGGYSTIVRHLEDYFVLRQLNEVVEDTYHRSYQISHSVFFQSVGLGYSFGREDRIQYDVILGYNRLAGNEISITPTNGWVQYQLYSLGATFRLRFLF